jgi:hypothetical protein
LVPIAFRVMITFWRWRESDKLVNDILRAKLGGRLTKNSDVTALALTKLNEGQPGALMEHWREESVFDPHGPEGDLEF